MPASRALWARAPGSAFSLASALEAPILCVQFYTIQPGTLDTARFWLDNGMTRQVDSHTIVFRLLLHFHCIKNRTVSSWIIVGGGPHGVHLAAALLERASLPPEALRIVDPEATLMAAWTRRAAAVGMSHLRSPSVHNVDTDPWSLQEFAERWTPQDGFAPFAPPYSRPSTSLFAAHSRAVIERLGLADLHVRARATGLARNDGGWAVECDDGRTLAAGRVVLALGPGRAERIPRWAEPFVDAPERWLQHVFDPRFDLDERPQFQRVAIIGGGISAAQLAVRFAAAGRQVWLVTPHRLRRAQFDSSPQWLGPAKMARFTRESDMAARRRMIDGARRPGTLTRDVERGLRAAIRAGAVRVVQDKVRGIFALDGRRALGLTQPLEIDAVALATGFEGMPGGPLLARLCPERFPRAACGSPIADAHLEWGEGLHVAGPLAELQLGPVARNIAGGLRAAERLVPVARERAGWQPRPADTSSSGRSLTAHARADR